MFEDATIENKNVKENVNNQKNVQDGALTTDDLVLFLGEKYIESRIQSRTIVALKKRVEDLESELYKIRSCNMSEEHEVSNLTAELESQIKALKEENESLRKSSDDRHEYIVALEDKVHNIVLEKESCEKEIVSLIDEIEKLKS